MEKDAGALLKTFLMQQKRKTVTLDAMQAECHRLDYASFHDAVAALERTAVLVPVKAGG